LYKACHMQAALLAAAVCMIAGPGLCGEKPCLSLSQAANSGMLVEGLCACLSGNMVGKRASLEFLTNEHGRIIEFSMYPDPDDEGDACVAEILTKAQFEDQGEPCRGRDTFDLESCSLTGMSHTLSSEESRKAWLMKHRKGTRILISGIVILATAGAVTTGAVAAYLLTSICLGDAEDQDCSSPPYVMGIAIAGGVMMAVGLVLLLVGHDIRKRAQASALQAIVPAVAITPLTKDGGMGASLLWRF
jgi:hypothetical protein